MNNKQLQLIAKQILPSPIHASLKAQLKGIEFNPPTGYVKFGDLRRLSPISKHFGFDRGQPIDRYYIDNFLAQNSGDIHGRVLEIGDNYYTKKYGGNKITQSDVFHAIEGNPEATIVGDLSSAEDVPTESFDCLILTQTLQLIYEVRLALKTIYRILKPGGVALVTIPGITSLSDKEWRGTWYWNYTTLSAQRLFEEVFPAVNVKVKTYGNVLSATAFLQGLATQELQQKELDYRDPNYEVIITIRAAKPKVGS